MKKMMFLTMFVAMIMLTECNQVMGFLEKDYYIYLDEG